MILGFNPACLEILRRMNISKPKFYLTGSRYFGYAQHDSDWDFFTGQDNSTLNHLEILGFNRLSMHPDWFDENCISIYHHPVDIHVAIVKDVELKKRTQAYIRDTAPRYLEMLKRDKSNSIRVWNEVYRILNGDKNVTKL